MTTSNSTASRPRVLIVGAGVAGLTCALDLVDAGTTDVVLVAKDGLGQGATVMAQGGVAAAWHPDDSIASHLADTEASGSGLADPDAVRAVTQAAPGAVAHLAERGVQWDRDGDLLETRRVGAHSFPRSAHAGGDGTGRVIAFALRDRVKEAAAAGRLEVREKALVTELLTVPVPRVSAASGGAGPEGRSSSVRVCGVRLADGTESEADAVVLAMGGAGQMYAVTTNLRSATGSGVALAYRAGAVIRDPEMLQFHPTALAAVGHPLLSEAVRGAGAHVIDAEGRRFLFDVDPRGELAGRDVVARAMYLRAQEQGEPVRLDARPIGTPDELAQLFPGITRQLKLKRLTWDEPIPVTPAAHYWMGGVAADVDGRTTLPGLFAIGETACTGMHGANRLATNSLLEGAVTGSACAATLSSELPGLRKGALPAPHDAGSVEVHAVNAESPASSAAVPALSDLQELMWSDAGVVRDGEGLDRTATALAGWSAGSAVPDEAASALRKRQELADLLTCARLLVAGAQLRRETRGAHARADFPQTDSVPVSRGFVRP